MRRLRHSTGGKTFLDVRPVAAIPSAALGSHATGLNTTGLSTTSFHSTSPQAAGPGSTRSFSAGDVTPGPSAASPLHLLPRSTGQAPPATDAADSPAAQPTKQLSTKVRRRGYVTTLSSILNKSPEEIEDTIGYGRGALKKGYTLYRLVSPVALPHFKWRGVTRDSAGFTFDAQSGEFVLCEFLLREEFAKKYNYDDAKIDGAIKRFMIGQAWRVNVRDGGDLIVKIVPNDQVTDFPPGGDAPQWELTAFLEFEAMASISGGQYLIWRQEWSRLGV
ncbi:hypothetical protein [Aliidongia dinghuensis]|nr:hypothetical protein [Aliidongia dinghuensis]